MTYVQCQHNGCREEAHSKVQYLEKYGLDNGFRCLKHIKELGDFDLNGRLDDKRRKE